MSNPLNSKYSYPPHLQNEAPQYPSSNQTSSSALPAISNSDIATRLKKPDSSTPRKRDLYVTKKEVTLSYNKYPEKNDPSGQHDISQIPPAKSSAIIQPRDFKNGLPEAPDTTNSDFGLQLKQPLLQKAHPLKPVTRISLDELSTLSHRAEPSLYTGTQRSTADTTRAEPHPNATMQEMSQTPRTQSRTLHASLEKENSSPQHLNLSTGAKYPSMTPDGVSRNHLPSVLQTPGALALRAPSTALAANGIRGNVVAMDARALDSLYLEVARGGLEEYTHEIDRCVAQDTMRGLTYMHSRNEETLAKNKLLLKLLDQEKARNQALQEEQARLLVQLSTQHQQIVQLEGQVHLVSSQRVHDWKNNTSNFETLTLANAALAKENSCLRAALREKGDNVGDGDMGDKRVKEGKCDESEAGQEISDGTVRSAESDYGDKGNVGDTGDKGDRINKRDKEADLKREIEELKMRIVELEEERVGHASSRKIFTRANVLPNINQSNYQTTDAERLAAENNFIPDALRRYREDGEENNLYGGERRVGGRVDFKS